MALSFGGLMAFALEHNHIHSTSQGANVSQQGAAAVAHVELSPPRFGSVLSRVIVGQLLVRGATPELIFVMWYYSTYTMSFSSSCNGGQTAAVACSTVAGVGLFPLVGRMWGFRSTPSVRQKIANRDTQLEVLDWIIDTEVHTATLPSHDRLKLHVILVEWPPCRASASVKQVSQLVGFLIHVSFAVRPGFFSITDCWLRLACSA